jgi:hypothetical protein
VVTNFLEEHTVSIFRVEVDIITAVTTSDLREIWYFTSITGYTHEDGHTNTESPDVSEQTVVKCRLQDSFVCVILIERVNSVKRSQQSDIAENPSSSNLYL